MTFDEAEWGQTGVMKGGNDHVMKMLLIHQRGCSGATTLAPNHLFNTTFSVDSPMKGSTSVNPWVYVRPYACAHVHPVWITYCSSN